MLDRLIDAVASVRRLVAGLGTAMGYLAGWGFILCAAFITFDVLARRFFGFSSQSTTEITGYALAFGISWGLAHTLTARAHVRIDVLINHLPPPLRYPMHLLSLAALGVFVAFIAWGAYALVDESLLFGATRHQPAEDPALAAAGALGLRHRGLPRADRGDAGRERAPARRRRGRRGRGAA